MPVYVGVDDTDSAQGMCTTYLVTEIIRRLNFPILYGLPRLVRLNPNIPWKTRGNGALSIILGGDAQGSSVVGEISGVPVLSSRIAAGVSDSLSVVNRAVRSVVEEAAMMDADNTNPGAVVSPAPVNEALYWKAVRGIVEKEEAILFAREAGAVVNEWKNGRGVIGAASALSWRGQNSTFELITYRYRHRWGTSRDINVVDVSSLSDRFPSTFNNYDRATRHPCIYPSSPCPVLYGIRGTRPEVLPEAMKTVRSEMPERWLLFETNQATDDHISVLNGSPSLFSSYVVQGTVRSYPETVRGGHVFFEMTTHEGIILLCAAFEETKDLRGIVRGLIPGDSITVWGAFKPPAGELLNGSLNIEKISVNALARRWIKKSNPVCSVCGRKMESVGRGKGYRCRKCKQRSDMPEMTEARRTVSPGIYSPTTSSRRHLSRPAEMTVQSGVACQTATGSQ